MNNGMSKAQGGFTLIELIIVIVVLGILASVAAPYFFNVSDDAESAAVKAQAKNLDSAIDMNNGGCLLTSHKATANKCVAINNCNQVGSLLKTGSLPSEFSVNDQAITGADGVAKTSCTLTKGTKTATFVAIKAGNS